MLGEDLSWKIVADVVNVCISLRNSDPFGEITHGSISLRGSICKFLQRISTTDGSIQLVIPGRSYPRGLITTYWDVVPHEFNEASRHQQCQNITPESLYLMPMAITEETGRIRMIYGLILQPIPKIKGRYMRTGVFCTSQGNNGWEDNLFSVFTGEMLQDDEYLEIDSDQRFTIEIV
jgi:hypothetical protein